MLIISDICCAIAGIVPAMGVHLDANRKPGGRTTPQKSFAVRVYLGIMAAVIGIFPTLAFVRQDNGGWKVPILVMKIDRSGDTRCFEGILCGVWNDRVVAPDPYSWCITPKRKILL
jgi:hypothetical protein